MHDSLIGLPAAGYSDPGFWAKLRAVGRRAGHELIEKSLWLYYAAERPETPNWAKAMVYGALAYFILPADAVPDLVPVAGFSDDFAVLALAVATIGAHVDATVKARAEEALARWFGR